MADTKKKQIVDALMTALQGITGIGKVTQDEREYTAYSVGDYPALLVQSSKPTVDRLSYPHNTADDMEAEMEIQIEGVVHNITASDIEGDADALRQDVEQAIVGNAALNALVKDIYLESDDDIADLDQNYGIFSAVYTAVYHYNHNTP